MKDETKSIPIVGFGGLKAKMYSFTKEDHKGEKTKRQKQLTLSKKMKHKEYINMLFRKEMDKS